MQSRQPKGTPTGDRFTGRTSAENDVSLADGVPWPQTEWQMVPWTTNTHQHGPDGRRPSYQDRILTEVEVEIPARIGDVDVQLPPDLADECREVETAITRLDAEYGEHLAGLSAFLVRSEAVASSRIERVNADLDDIARASITEEASRAARETAAASAAMDSLIGAQKPGARFHADSLLTAHGALLKDDRDNGHYAGRYRDVQNWIGPGDFSPRKAVHVPPPPEEVRPLMNDLARFMNRSDMPPMAQAALAHGQFEAIHPFVDGNGRIGRGLIAVTLRRRAVAQQIVVPAAATMLADVDTYFDTLVAYRRGDAQGMVSYINKAADHATAEAAVSAKRLSELPDKWRDQVRPRARSGASVLIDELTATPVLDAATAQRITGRSAPRAYEALDRLTEAGVLREATGAARDRVWVTADVMDEIEDLDDRIGRRAKPAKHWR